MQPFDEMYSRLPYEDKGLRDHYGPYKQWLDSQSMT